MIITSRRRSRMAVAVVAVLLSAGCSAPILGRSASAGPRISAGSSSSAPMAPQPLARGAEGPVESVPWAQVGPGWRLATWRPVADPASGPPPPPGVPTRETVTTTLYLINPDGGRYAITTFPPPGADGLTPELVDWSGDGGRALFSGEDSLVEIDLRSGKHTRIAVGGYARYTRPQGKALLLVDSGFDEPTVLKRVDLAGKPQLTYPIELPENWGGYLSTPDGTQLVVSADTGLVLMGNDGKANSALPVAGRTICAPMRWWDGAAGTTVLASCMGDGDNPVSRLWKVPIDGGAPTALTGSSDDQPDTGLGDVSAWQVPAGTFVQGQGGCGAGFLTKLNADGTTTKVDVPDLDPNRSVSVVGVHGGNLDLIGHVKGCGSGESLVEYDAGAGTTTVLLGPRLNGGAAVDALPYPGQD